MTPRRCHWVTSDEEYIAYHDQEWGKAEKNSQKLFEMLCLDILSDYPPIPKRNATK